MIRRRRQAAEDRGQALVEFALVAPIFFLMLFGIIQLGLVFAGQNALVNGVRETARYAAPYRVVDASGAASTCSTVQSKLTDVLKGSLIGFNAANLIPTITYTWVQSTMPLDTSWYVTVTVHAEYKFPLYVPLVGNFMDGMDGINDGNLRLSAQEVMRIENDPLATGDTTTAC